MRIVSLLPSATEIICALGLRQELVGVTHECDFPPEVAALPRVTRTHIPTDASSAEIDRLVRDQLGSRGALYSLDLPILESLRPDLIVTQTLCDVCAVAEREVADAACALPGNPRVLNLEPQTLDEVLESMLALGRSADRTDRAEQIVAGYRQCIERVRSRVAVAINEGASSADRNTSRPRVVVLEWADPLFTCGHWSPQIIEWAGGREVLAAAGQKSRRMKWRELIDAAPDVLILALCGFDIDRSVQEVDLLRRRPEWQAIPAVRNGRAWVTDGSAYFSRPGPRLVDALELTAHLLHPRHFDLPPRVIPPRRVE